MFYTTYAFCDKEIYETIQYDCKYAIFKILWRKQYELKREMMDILELLKASTICDKLFVK